MKSLKIINQKVKRLGEEIFKNSFNMVDVSSKETF